MKAAGLCEFQIVDGRRKPLSQRNGFGARLRNMSISAAFCFCVRAEVCFCERVGTYWQNLAIKYDQICIICFSSFWRLDLPDTAVLLPKPRSDVCLTYLEHYKQSTCVHVGQHVHSFVWLCPIKKSSGTRKNVFKGLKTTPGSWRTCSTPPR